MLNESDVFSPWQPAALTGPLNAGTNAALVTFTPTVTTTLNITLQVPYGGPNNDGGAPPLPSSTTFKDGTMMAVRDAVTDTRNSLALQRCVYGGQRNSSQWWTMPSVTNRNRCIMAIPPAVAIDSPPRLVLADNSSDSRCDWRMLASGNSTYILSDGESCATLRSNGSEPYLIAGSCNNKDVLAFGWDGTSLLTRLASNNSDGNCLSSVEPNVVIRAAVTVKAISGAAATVSLISRQDYNITVALNVTQGVPVQLLVLVPVHDCGSTEASLQACRPDVVAQGIADQIGAASDFEQLQALHAARWEDYWGQMQVKHSYQSPILGWLG
jgi:hypothetical protein